MIYLAALLLGMVAGLRTFTAPAVLALMRHRSLWAYILALAALAEYAADLYPKAPARTGIPGLTARIVSGAACGWVVAAGASPWLGAALGVLGALAGAYGGLALRRRAIGAIGSVPAALLEDAVAIAGAVAIVAFAA